METDVETSMFFEVHFIMENKKENDMETTMFLRGYFVLERR